MHISKSYELLRLLVESVKALSKSDRQERLWPSTFVSEATLASVVGGELRDALGESDVLGREPDAAVLPRALHSAGLMGVLMVTQASC